MIPCGEKVCGRLYNWAMDFLLNRTFQVEVGSEISGSFSIKNGIPRGSAILFNIMINDIFESTGKGIESSLFADDGAIWKGKNVSFVMKAI